MNFWIYPKSTELVVYFGIFLKEMITPVILNCFLVSHDMIFIVVFI